MGSKFVEHPIRSGIFRLRDQVDIRTIPHKLGLVTSSTKPVHLCANTVVMLDGVEESDGME